MSYDFLSSHSFWIVGCGSIFLVWIFSQSVVLVPGDKIALVERKWMGKSMPEGRAVAMRDEVGVRARTLGPGLHLFLPLIFRTRLVPMMSIEDNEIGVVESIDGASLNPGRIFARSTAEHNFFQDGEAFLKNGGEKGPQIQLLTPGLYRINPYLFRVQKYPILNIKIMKSEW